MTFEQLEILNFALIILNFVCLALGTFVLLLWKAENEANRGMLKLAREIIALNETLIAELREENQ